MTDAVESDGAMFDDTRSVNVSGSPAGDFFAYSFGRSHHATNRNQSGLPLMMLDGHPVVPLPSRARSTQLALKRIMDIVLAGGALLGKWRFSEATVQAISAQDAPATLTGGNWLADALHFTASVLPQGLGTPFVASVGDNQPNASRIAHAVASSGEFMQRHNLDPDAVDTMLQQTSKTFAEIHKVFGG